MKNSERTEITTVPQGYTTITPWIISKDSAQLIEFLKVAFDAEEAENRRVYNEDGTIGHSEVRIGNAVVMLFDAKEGWPSTPSFIRLYVKDGDAVFQKALHAGARPVTAMTLLFFGDQVGRIRDPFGNIWWIQERMEEVSDFQELGKRAQAHDSIEAMKYVQESLDQELHNRA